MSNHKPDIENFLEELGLPLQEAAELYYELADELAMETLKLQTFIAEHDLENQKRIIHNIKGFTGNYRISDVYELSSKLYDLLKLGNLDEAVLLLPHFFSLCETATREIEMFFAEKGCFRTF